MPVSKAQQKAVHKYEREHYDRLGVSVPKGKRDLIKAHADAQGESMNSFINRAIDERILTDKLLEYFKKSVEDHFSRMSKTVSVIHYSIDGFSVDMLVEENEREYSDTQISDDRKSSSSFIVIFHRHFYDFNVYESSGKAPGAVLQCMQKIGRDMYGRERSFRRSLNLKVTEE